MRVRYTEAVATTIAAFFERYRRAFADYDLEGLAGLVHLPCLIASAGTLVAVGQAGDLRRRLQRQFDRHREAEVTEARFEVRAHRRLDPRFVIADVHWTLTREGGVILSEFGVHYTLTAPEHGWRIASVLPLDLPPPT